MKRLKLSRRAMLRGGAVALGLPLLEAMLNDNATALADGAPLPCRFVSYFWADGMNIDRFEPLQTGSGWTLSEEMMPLAPVKDYLNVITGLQNPNTFFKTHHQGMTVFNGYDFIDRAVLDTDAGGPTIDQLIADAVDAGTLIRAVHVQNSKRESFDGDGGTTAIAMSHRGTPDNLIAQVPESNPVEVWRTLFGEFGGAVDDAPRLKVLDAVRADIERLDKRLGARDKQRLEAHLVAIEELERKIEAVTPQCALPEIPSEQNVDVMGREPLVSVQQVMSELIAQAFVCDITRVASFMFKRFASDTTFDDISPSTWHHSASHEIDQPDYHNGVVYSMERLAQFLQVLRQTEDVVGDNLLDSTIVYASTDCSIGHSHSVARQPIIIAGRGRGYLAHPGIHYQAVPWNGKVGLPLELEQPNGAGSTSDALLTCLRAFVPDAPSVGAGPGLSRNVISDVIAT